MSLYSFHPSDPGPDDDILSGYYKGHRWINIRGRRELVCTDHTAAAAVWEEDAGHHIIQNMSFTGVQVWKNVGVYWAVSGGDFFLERGGVGYINGERVIWAAGQDIALTVNACNFIRIDADGIIDVGTSWTAQDFKDYINLFEVWYVSDSEYIVCKEDHPVSMPAETSIGLHQLHGTVFIVATGAQITRVAAGSGEAAADRELKIVNADILEDHGLETTIPDSGGAGVTWEWLYTNGSGDWRRDAHQTEAVMKWNDAGTPTALGNFKFGVYRLAATKDAKNTADPIYLAAMGDAEYDNIGQARNAIVAGVVDFTNEIDLLEAAQLGYIIVQNNVSGGFISEVTIEKDIIAGNVTGAGATNVAALVSVDTTLFDGVLSATDATVQSALETIDDYYAQLTKTKWFLVASEGVAFPYNVNVGDFPATETRSNEAVFFTGVFPADFSSIVKMVVVMIPDATEMVQADLDSDYGAAGEDYNNHSDSEANAQLAVTTNKLTEFDVSGVFDVAAPSAGDYFGLQFASDTASLRIIGLRLDYL